MIDEESAGVDQVLVRGAMAAWGAQQDDVLLLTRPWLVS